MKIVVAGGQSKADFLIDSLLENNHNLIVINDDPDYSHYLAETHHIPIMNGDPCKIQILRDAKIDNADILIALGADDADNLAICQAAKKIFGVKKTVCIVSNPKNVVIFKNLGVNTVISATQIISEKMILDNSEKTRQKKGLVSKKDSQLDTINELLKNPCEAHTELTWNQGISISDNKNSVRANPKNSTLLEDFVPSEEIMHSVHQCAIKPSKGTGDYGFFNLITFH